MVVLFSFFIYFQNFFLLGLYIDFIIIRNIFSLYSEIWGLYIYFAANRLILKFDNAQKLIQVFGIKSVVWVKRNAETKQPQPVTWGSTNYPNASLVHIIQNTRLRYFPSKFNLINNHTCIVYFFPDRLNIAEKCISPFFYIVKKKLSLKCKFHTMKERRIINYGIQLI